MKINAVRQTLDSWLSKCPTPESNRYSILLDNIDETDNIAENNMINNNDKISEQKSSKPPSIFVQNIKYIGNLTNALNSISNCKYELKVLKNNEIKIFALDFLSFTNIKDSY